MTSPRDDPMEELTSRSLFPWVDQIALSVVVSALGRGRPGPAPDGLDGEMTLHWHAPCRFFCTYRRRTIGLLRGPDAR